MKIIALINLLRSVSLFMIKQADKWELQNKIANIKVTDKVYVKSCNTCQGTGMTPASMCGCFCNCWEQNVSIG